MSGPPYRCWGGAELLEDADDLREIHLGEGRQVSVVESLDDPRWCPYVWPGSVTRSFVAPLGAARLTV